MGPRRRCADSYVRAGLLSTGEDRLRLRRARGAEVVLVRELGGRGGEEEGLQGGASSRAPGSPRCELQGLSMAVSGFRGFNAARALEKDSDERGDDTRHVDWARGVI